MKSQNENWQTVATPFIEASEQSRLLEPDEVQKLTKKFAGLSEFGKAEVVRKLTDYGFGLASVADLFEIPASVASSYRTISYVPADKRTPKTSFPDLVSAGAKFAPAAEQVFPDTAKPPQRRAICPPSQYGDLDLLHEQLRDFLGETRTTASRKPSKTRVEKVIVCSDTHAPYEKWEDIKTMIHDEAKDTDLLIVAGDIGDQKSVSRWPKAGLVPRLVEEFKRERELIRIFSENFPRVVLLDGNHDLRAAKKFAMLFDGCPDLREFLTEAYPDLMKTTQLVASGLENVSMAPKLTYEDAEFCFLYQIGDFIVGHPEISSSVPNKAVDRFIQWLNGVALPYGLINPFRVAAMGHTHHYGETTHIGGYVGIELGCMCKVPEYSGDSQLKSGLRPITRGYLRAFLRDGVKYDFNASKYIRLSNV